jgi:hypothetical protein
MERVEASLGFSPWSSPRYEVKEHHRLHEASISLYHICYLSHAFSHHNTDLPYFYIEVLYSRSFETLDLAEDALLL